MKKTCLGWREGSRVEIKSHNTFYIHIVKITNVKSRAAIGEILVGEIKNLEHIYM